MKYKILLILRFWLCRICKLWKVDRIAFESDTGWQCVMVSPILVHLLTSTLFARTLCS